MVIGSDQSLELPGEEGRGSSVVRSCGMMGGRMCRMGPGVRGGRDSSLEPTQITQWLPGGHLRCLLPSLGLGKMEEGFQFYLIQDAFQG